MALSKILPGCDYCYRLLPTMRLGTTRGIIWSAHICRACLFEALEAFGLPV